ncbi:alkaline phosphatase D family protein [Saccharicrinis sp. 156]|uniref:alkaline phosphatase D family protein n=1 Tax=Saccharicrinis sp. 156 TaxID=3417574 RepID=UPI003D335896
MQSYKLTYPLLFFTVFCTSNCLSQIVDKVSLTFNVTLKDAHKGSLHIDTMLLNSYASVPPNIKQFYLDARRIFQNNMVDFTNKQIVEAAVNNGVSLMGGPMLGDLKSDGVSIWIRPSSDNMLLIKVVKTGCKKEKTFVLNPVVAGKEQRVVIDGLTPNIDYDYHVLSNNTIIATGAFKTAPKSNNKGQVRLVFGSCFHKIGLHNPNLINTVLKREPHAMMLLGDIAVDDRNKNFGMHRSDYQLRDISRPWQKLAANTPLYTSWDDHDYRNNDLSGVSGKFTAKDREEIRKIWRHNWNNPPRNAEGVYFKTRIGQVELIMLDTRSCRKVQERDKYASYLGEEQLEWLKKALKNSDAPFKIISSGTMWSDDISNGKDSWGTWDKQAREEVFSLIEKENIPGVLLISGDRHGARGFTIPRESGFKLYEFEAASLGGVPGPDAMAKDPTNQLFGYKGLGLKAFGEFTFNTQKREPQVTFRLIDEFGNIMEEHKLSYKMLTPQ